MSSINRDSDARLSAGVDVSPLSSKTFEFETSNTQLTVTANAQLIIGGLIPSSTPAVNSNKVNCQFRPIDLIMALVVALVIIIIVGWLLVNVPCTSTYYFYVQVVQENTCNTKIIVPSVIVSCGDHYYYYCRASPLHVQ